MLRSFDEMGMKLNRFDPAEVGVPNMIPCVAIGGAGPCREGVGLAWVSRRSAPSTLGALILGFSLPRLRRPYFSMFGRVLGSVLFGWLSRSNTSRWGGQRVTPEAIQMNAGVLPRSTPEGADGPVRSGPITGLQWADRSIGDGGVGAWGRRGEDGVRVRLAQSWVVFEGGSFLSTT